MSVTHRRQHYSRTTNSHKFPCNVAFTLSHRPMISTTHIGSFKNTRKNLATGSSACTTLIVKIFVYEICKN